MGWCVVIEGQPSGHKHRAEHEESEGHIADRVIPFPFMYLQMQLRK